MLNPAKHQLLSIMLTAKLEIIMKEGSLFCASNAFGENELSISHAMLTRMNASWMDKQTNRQTDDRKTGGHVHKR